MSRQVRMARSVGRPSRRKKLPGMRPAAYMRSSTSTVKGKKSMPSRTERAALAVTSTWVLPRVATIEPWLWNASLPVSNVIVLVGARDGRLYDDGVCHRSLSSPAALRLAGSGAVGPVPSRRHPRRWERATDN
jgi:hypothetical protein